MAQHLTNKKPANLVAGRADETADLISFLISSAASYVSGTGKLVDGGQISGIDAAGGANKLL